MKDWFVYIVRCHDDSLYTGITRDPVRRVDEHNNNDLLGSKFTRARRPVNLVYQEPHRDRSQATKREIEIKRLCRKDKEALILE